MAGVPTRLLRHSWQRLLDGDRPWGSLDIRPDRFGVTRYQLVVYPPGISESERRRVRVARGWPLWGAAAWIVCEIVLSHTVAPWVAIAVSSAAYFTSGVVAVTMAGAARRRVRTLAAIVMAGHRDPVSTATRDRVEALASTLIDADERLATGQLSPAEHELVWWRVYDRMDLRTGPLSPPG
jgi:hypothetical protein